MTMRDLCDNIIIQGDVILSVWENGEELERKRIHEDNGLSPEFKYETEDGAVRMKDYADFQVNYLYYMCKAMVIELERSE